MLAKISKLPILKRLIPSIGVRLLKLINKNRNFFLIKNIYMFLDFLDPIDREIILTKEFEKEEFEYLLNQINKNKINYFLDVGANCGYYSLKISNEITNIKVFSFEPNEEAHLKFSKSLEKNLELSKKINLYKFGLSNKTSKLKMKSMIKFGYAQTGGTSVITNDKETDNFVFFAEFKIGDDLINLENKNLAIKIDIEGHELNALLGLKKTLISNQCILQIEIFEKNFDEVNNFLFSLGFKNFYRIKKRSNYFYRNF